MNHNFEPTEHPNVEEPDDVTTGGSEHLTPDAHQYPVEPAPDYSPVPRIYGVLRIAIDHAAQEAQPIDPISARLIAANLSEMAGYAPEHSGLSAFARDGTLTDALRDEYLAIATNPRAAAFSLDLLWPGVL